MNYYNEIKNKLIDNEIYEKAKDYSKERNKVITYFEIGRLLNEAGSKYGEDIIGKYSEKLMIEVGKKYNPRTLRSMKQLYITFNDDFWKPLVSKLNWTNLLLIMPLKDKDKMYYYANLSIKENLSKRQLQLKIKNKEYERLDNKTKEKLITKEKTKVTDFIKNPIIIKKSNNYEEISEKVLKRLILEDMKNFLKELGEGFTYISDEYKIKIGDTYNYIDLLLYNIKYRCYVIIELKVTDLKKEHIGQIQIYMNYVNKNIKSIYEDKTIGIIIVKKDNKFVMEYCSDERVYRATYILN